MLYAAVFAIITPCHIAGLLLAALADFSLPARHAPLLMITPFFRYHCRHADTPRRRMLILLRLLRFATPFAPHVDLQHATLLMPPLLIMLSIHAAILPMLF